MFVQYNCILLTHYCKQLHTYACVYIASIFMFICTCRTFNIAYLYFALPPPPPPKKKNLLPMCISVLIYMTDCISVRDNHLHYWCRGNTGKRMVRVSSHSFGECHTFPHYVKFLQCMAVVMIDNVYM